MTAIAAQSYKIASGDTLTNLEKAVNQFIAGGWMPYGPPFITHDHRIVQAMILPIGVKAAPGAGMPSAPTAPPVQPAQPQPHPHQSQAQPQPQQLPAQGAGAPVPQQVQPRQGQPVAAPPRA